MSLPKVALCETIKDCANFKANFDQLVIVETKPVKPEACIPVTLILAVRVYNLGFHCLLQRILLVYAVIQQKIQVASWVFDVSVPRDVLCLDRETVEVVPKVLVLALINGWVGASQRLLRALRGYVKGKICKFGLILIDPLVNGCLNLLVDLFSLCFH